MLKKLVSIVIVLGLVSSASALVISDTQTWDGRTSINGQDGGGIEITGTGSLTINGRVDHDNPGWLLIRSGGQFYQVDNGGEDAGDGYKLPDNDEGGPGPTITIEGGGYLEVLATESIAERLYEGGVFLDVCGTYVTNNIDRGDRQDPRSSEWKIYPTGDATGYDITVEGNTATIHGTPEPATIMLLGLGGLALIRRRK